MQRYYDGVSVVVCLFVRLFVVVVLHAATIAKVKRTVLYVTVRWGVIFCSLCSLKLLSFSCRDGWMHIDRERHRQKQTHTRLMMNE